MAQRVSPTEALRAQIDELFASGQELATILEQVGRLTVHLMMQTAIETEVDGSSAGAATSAKRRSRLPVIATATSPSWR